jgi:proline iminopeptidase
VLNWLLLPLSVIVGWAAAVIMFFGPAVVISNIAVLLTIGVGAGLLATWLAARMALRPAGLRHSDATAIGIAVFGMAILAVASAGTIFDRLPSTVSAQQMPPIPAGMHYWNLSTGSHLAYLEVPAKGEAQATPVILVGGGPGEEDVADTSGTEFFGQLSQLGYDVYFYDQIGSGLSARLDNPADYTVGRHVADLEAIRQSIGARQLILMGSSWGGTLVANYMASHPSSVAKAVFTSPGPMNEAEWPQSGSVTSRLTKSEQEQADALIPRNPRFVAWYVLGSINPRAAHNMVSDQEGDAFLDTFLQIVLRATVCDPAHLPNQTSQGTGLYDNMFTTRDAQSTHPGVNPRTVLASNQTPSLILTGGCNYVDWAVTWQYRTTLPNSTLVCYPHAGHEIYRDEPDLYLETIRSFLQDTSLPVQPWTSAAPCTTKLGTPRELG